MVKRYETFICTCFDRFLDRGSIIVDGVDVTHLPEYKRAKYLGRVFQDPMTGTAADMQTALTYMSTSAARISGLRWITLISAEQIR